MEVMTGNYTGAVLPLVIHTGVAVTVAVCITVFVNLARDPSRLDFLLPKTEMLYNTSTKKFHLVPRRTSEPELIFEVPFGLRVTLPLALSGVADILYPLS